MHEQKCSCIACNLKRSYNIDVVQLWKEAGGVINESSKILTTVDAGLEAFVRKLIDKMAQSSAVEIHGKAVYLPIGWYQVVDGKLKVGDLAYSVLCWDWEEPSPTSLGNDVSNFHCVIRKKVFESKKG